MTVLPIRDPGLGNTSYLVDLGDGSALVIDPQRDPSPYLEAAERRNLVIRHVAETHLHADFVSGARELVAQGAGLIAPRLAGLAHPHRGVAGGDELALGDFILWVVDTPGHTPEHVSFVLYDRSTPLVAFTGGSLSAGGVARPDLVSDDLTETLAHQAYRSVHLLLRALPPHVEIRPTHGGGSFCSSAGVVDGPVSTVGAERHNHPAVVASDAGGFVSDLLAGLGSYPDYFRRLREVNRLGPGTFGVTPPPLARVPVEDLDDHIVVDVRPIERFAAGHIPGSVSIELRDQLGTWLGWLFEPDTSLVFVHDPDQDQRDIVRQALNIGHERLAGRIDLDDWLGAGGELVTTDVVPPVDIPTGAVILDVRQRTEWDRGHVPGALHVELGDLAKDPTRVPPGVIAHCGHGQRAMTAASLLARSGRAPAGITTAGPARIATAPALT